MNPLLVTLQNKLLDKNQNLSNLVQWMDEIYHEDKSFNGLPQQIITRAIIAVGYLLLDEGKLDDEQFLNIKKTINSASEFVLFPSVKNADQYFRDATNSYPFGLGEGCYSVNELGKNKSCGKGTGCQSGAGSLMCTDKNSDLILKVINENLLPWISGEKDAVLENYS